MSARVPGCSARGDQSQAEEMRLPTAHRLLKVEDRLGGSACETGNPFTVMRLLHALGDVGPLKKGLTVALSVDQFVKLLDLVTQLDGKRIRLQLAGIADGFRGLGTPFICTCPVGRFPLSRPGSIYWCRAARCTSHIQ